MAKVPSLKSISTLACSHVLLDFVEETNTRHSENTLTLLEDGVCSAVAEDILYCLLSLYTEKVTDRILKAVAPCHLTELKVEKRLPQLTFFGLTEVMKKCKHLQKVSLKECDQLMSPGQFVLWRRLGVGITALCLESCHNVTDQVVQSALRHIPTLKHLNISSCESITETVFLLNEDQQKEREFMPLLDKSHHYGYSLESVDVSGCPGITSTAVRHLTSLTGPTLKNVNLSWTSVNLIAILSLAGYSLPALIELVISFYNRAEGLKDPKNDELYQCLMEFKNTLDKVEKKQELDIQFQDIEHGQTNSACIVSQNWISIDETEMKDESKKQNGEASCTEDLAFNDILLSAETETTLSGKAEGPVISESTDELLVAQSTSNGHAELVHCRNETNSEAKSVNLESVNLDFDETFRKCNCFSISDKTEISYNSTDISLQDEKEKMTDVCVNEHCETWENHVEIDSTQFQLFSGNASFNKLNIQKNFGFENGASSKTSCPKSAEGYEKKCICCIKTEEVNLNSNINDKDNCDMDMNVELQTPSGIPNLPIDYLEPSSQGNPLNVSEMPSSQGNPLNVSEMPSSQGNPLNVNEMPSGQGNPLNVNEMPSRFSHFTPFKDDESSVQCNQSQEKEKYQTFRDTGLEKDNSHSVSNRSGDSCTNEPERLITNSINDSSEDHCANSQYIFNGSQRVSNSLPHKNATDTYSVSNRACSSLINEQKVNNTDTEVSLSRLPSENTSTSKNTNITEDVKIDPSDGDKLNCLLVLNKDRIVQTYKPQLVSVDVTNKFSSVYESVGFDCLKEFLQCVPNLQKFGMSWTGLTDEMVKDLTPYLKELREINLNDCELVTYGITHIGQTCKNLVKVDFNGIHFIKDIFLRPFLQNPNLQSLYLAESDISDGTLFRLATGIMNRLEELDLSWCDEVTVQGLNAMCRKPSSIEKLSFRHCPASTLTLSLMAENFKYLQSINICSVDSITDSSVVYLVENLPLLREIDISWNSGLTDICVNALLRSCIHLKRAVLSGLKYLTSAPFLPIISDLRKFRRSQALLRFKLHERNVLKENAEYHYSSDEEYEELHVPHRSTTYAPNLRILELEYCDCVDDNHLAEIVAVCRGSLFIVDYFREAIKPVMIHAQKGKVYLPPQAMLY